MGGVCLEVRVRSSCRAPAGYGDGSLRRSEKQGSGCRVAIACQEDRKLWRLESPLRRKRPHRLEKDLAADSTPESQQASFQQGYRGIVRVPALLFVGRQRSPYRRKAATRCGWRSLRCPSSPAKNPVSRLQRVIKVFTFKGSKRKRLFLYVVHRFSPGAVPFAGYHRRGCTARI